MRGDLRNNKLVPYSDDNDGHDWDFPNVPRDPHVYNPASLRRDSDGTVQLCGSANFVVHVNRSEAFSWTLRKPTAIKKRDSTIEAKAVALERAGVVEETSAASLAGCNVEMIDMVLECCKVHATMDCLSTELLAFAINSFVKQLCNLRFILLRMHFLQSKLGEGRFVGISKPLSAILRGLLNNAPFLKSNWCPRSLVRSLLRRPWLTLQTPGAGQNSLAANSCRSLGASLLKSALELFQCVVDHVRAEPSRFHASKSERRDVSGTLTCQKPQDIRQVIAEGLDCDRNWPDFGAMTTLLLTVPRVLQVMVGARMALAHL